MSHTFKVCTPIFWIVRCFLRRHNRTITRSHTHRHTQHATVHAMLHTFRNQICMYTLRYTGRQAGKLSLSRTFTHCGCVWMIMYIYAYVYVYTHIFIHTYIHIRINLSLSLYIYVHVRMYVFIYTLYNRKILSIFLSYIYIWKIDKAHVDMYRWRTEINSSKTKAINKSHTNTNQSHHTISHTTNHMPYVTSHIIMSHVTHTKETCHTHATHGAQSRRRREVSTGKNSQKVSSILLLHSKSSSELTFGNFYLLHHQHIKKGFEVLIDIHVWGRRERFPLLGCCMYGRRHWVYIYIWCKVWECIMSEYLYFVWRLLLLSKPREISFVLGAVHTHIDIFYMT